MAVDRVLTSHASREPFNRQGLIFKLAIVGAAPVASCDINLSFGNFSYFGIFGNLYQSVNQPQNRSLPSPVSCRNRKVGLTAGRYPAVRKRTY
jgi:hypothetical protein